MKSIWFLTSLLSLSLAQAASMSTPEATLKFVSADGFPVSGVALSGIFSFEALSKKKCGLFEILNCGDSKEEYNNHSEGGQVLGRTDANGSLVFPATGWKTEMKSARKLKVLFFTNATFDVTCNEKGEEKFKGFVDLLPQWVDGKLTEREYDCSQLEYKQGDKKTIEFKCTSIKTMEQIQAEVDKIKSTCLK